MAPFSIVMLVGTDHHAFQRAVDWADRRTESHPQDKVFIQYGRTSAPARADGAAFLSPAEMREAVAGADVVITHGGPGTISDARSGGHLPIVFPRDPQHGEHVDDHQQRFAAWCQRRGLVRFARTTEDLDRLMGELPQSGTREERNDHSASAEAIATVATLLDSDLTARRVAPGAPVVLHLSGDEAEVAQVVEALCEVSGVAVLGAVGDLLRLSRRGARCGCGETIEVCGFWSEVGRLGFGGWEAEAARGLSSDAPITTRRFRAGQENREKLLGFSAPYQAVYRAAWALSGARVLVDTTPGVAEALSHDAGIDLRVLHLGGPVPRSLRKRKVPVEVAGVQEVRERAGQVLDRFASGRAPASATPSHPLDARLSLS
jgi:UDP-N-acetylglucosamine transferase subunit ALG13